VPSPERHGITFFFWLPCHIALLNDVQRSYQAYQKAEEEIKNNGGDEEGGVQVNVFPDSRETSPISEKQGEESEAPNAAESEPDTNVDAELDAMFEDMSRSQAAPHEATYVISIFCMLSDIMVSQF